MTLHNQDKNPGKSLCTKKVAEAERLKAHKLLTLRETYDVVLSFGRAAHRATLAMHKIALQMREMTGSFQSVDSSLRALEYVLRDKLESGIPGAPQKERFHQ